MKTMEEVRHRDIYERRNIFPRDDVVLMYTCTIFCMTCCSGYGVGDFLLLSPVKSNSFSVT
jgi:hypothetical protein